MYKAVNINENTYKELHKIATQSHTPKARIVESLVKKYSRDMNKREKIKLEKFNKEMGAKIKALKFSKKIKVNTDNIDEDFAVLADSDYIM